MILLANTMSSTRNTLDVIFFLACRPNLISIALFIFRTAIHHRLHTVIERKNIKTLIAWFRLHVLARIYYTELKLFSMRQCFLYSSGISLMVRFMYWRSKFVAYIRYAHLLLLFFSLRRFFITGQNLNVVLPLDLTSYFDIAFLLPRRNSATAFLIPGILLYCIHLGIIAIQHIIHGIKLGYCHMQTCSINEKKD